MSEHHKIRFGVETLIHHADWKTCQIESEEYEPIMGSYLHEFFCAGFPFARISHSNIPFSCIISTPELSIVHSIHGYAQGFPQCQHGCFYVQDIILRTFFLSDGCKQWTMSNNLGRDGSIHPHFGLLRKYWLRHVLFLILRLTTQGDFMIHGTNQNNSLII